jgi:hypothetical protein
MQSFSNTVSYSAVTYNALQNPLLGFTACLGEVDPSYSPKRFAVQEWTPTNVTLPETASIHALT